MAVTHTVINDHDTHSD